MRETGNGEAVRRAVTCSKGPLVLGFKPGLAAVSSVGSAHRASAQTTGLYSANRLWIVHRETEKKNNSHQVIITALNHPVLKHFEMRREERDSSNVSVSAVVSCYCLF